MILTGLKRVIFNLLFGLIFLSSYAASASSIVSKVRLNNQQQLEIIISNHSEFKPFFLSNPNRLVIDIKDAKSLKLPAFYDKSDILKDVSVSNYNKNDQPYLRIVLNLKQKITIENAHFQKIRNERSGKIILQLDGNFSKKIYQQPNKIIIKQEQDDDELAAQPEAVQQPSVSQVKSNNLDNLIAKLSDDDSSNQKNDTQQQSVLADGSVKFVVKKPVIDNENTGKVLTKKERHIPVIVIDPGHGGRDPGTIGNYARSKEKNITLAYAKELKIALEKAKKYKVYLTRNSDVFIPLGKRVEIARKVKADLFISLHANSAASKRVSGLSIYTLSQNSSDKQAELLAEKENRSDIIAGVDFSNTSPDIMKTLINMSQRDSMNNSAIYANIAIKSMQNSNIEILNNTHRFAGFRVLTAPDMASVLIELGYLSNHAEERKLNDFRYRKKIATSLLDSIDRYFTSSSIQN